MSSLWMVTSGEYSDYGVCGIFDTEEAAKAAVVLGVGEDISEIDYYRSGDQPTRRTVWRASSGAIGPDGELRQGVGWPSITSTEEWQPSSRLDRPKVSQEAERGMVWIEVAASTKELAEKILYDRIAKVRAELLGL